MKNNNYIMKSLIATTAIAFIFIVLSSYFAWDREQYKNELTAVQSELAWTQEELASTQENYRVEFEKVMELRKDLNRISAELEEANTTITDLKDSEYKLVYMGNFKITYYCDSRYPHICGGNGMTASGKPTEVGVTAAADWSVLPRGSMVYIEGIGFREIQDVGGAVNNNHIDVLVQEHQEALRLGTDNEGVWLLIKNNK